MDLNDFHKMCAAKGVKSLYVYRAVEGYKVSVNGAHVWDDDANRRTYLFRSPGAVVDWLRSEGYTGSIVVKLIEIREIQYNLLAVTPAGLRL